MIPFEMVEPTSLNEAVSLLDPQEPTIRPVAGGTALMLMMKAGVFTADASDLPAQASSPSIRALRYRQRRTPHRRDGDAAPSGKGCHRCLAAARAARAMLTLSNVRVRNVARVGGALAHGDPHMDLPPVFSALAPASPSLAPTPIAKCRSDLYAGYYETVLEKNELITAVTVPALNGRKAAYMKVTSRTVEDWPALGVAVTFALRTARFAIQSSSSAPRPRKSRA